MKYGLGYLKNTKNLGDDIWAYATMKKLPHYEYLIDYREIPSFQSQDNEDVAVFMTGFLMTAGTLTGSFMPSGCIIPKFISSHFRPGSYEWLQEGEIYAYMKKHEPIGARDYYTKWNLKNIGIRAKYTGCITLTLDPPYAVKKDRQKYVCLVDVDDAVIEFVKKELCNTDIAVRILTHTEDSCYRELPWAERVRKVEEYLDLYANAHCVVTSRLHVGLPCLAFQTPVLTLKRYVMQKNDFNERRFAPYIKYLHFAYNYEFIKKQIDYSLISPPANKDGYLAIREALHHECSVFIDACETGRYQ